MLPKGKTIVAIFAHPDDETFGPGGTLHKLAHENDVYIICATKGEAGQNFLEDSTEHISSIREKELISSAKMLGIKEVFFLGFEDGTLSNNLYHRIAERIMLRLDHLKPEILMTYENRGVSGHLDHIAMSMITTYVFYKLDYIKEVYYYCLVNHQALNRTDYFIYFPPGYKKSEVDLTVDVSDVWELKVNAMLVHKSQTKDVERILTRYKTLPKEENFFILKK